jgi:hypothetical protein
MKPYLLWIDYGSEGWSYLEFDVADDMVKFILQNSRGPYLLTKRLDVKLVEP